MDPLPSKDKIYNMVQQEEHHKRVVVNGDIKMENIGAFAVIHLARPSAMQGVKTSCRHCGKAGHEEASYFELIGYPVGWSNRGGRGRNLVNVEEAEATLGEVEATKQQMQHMYNLIL